MSTVSKFLQNDTVQRVYKTFIQAAVAVTVAQKTSVVPSTSVVKSAAVAGLAAAAAFIWNGVILASVTKVRANKSSKFSAAVNAAVAALESASKAEQTQTPSA